MGALTGHDFTRLVRAQLGADLRGLPAAVRSRLSAGGAAADCVNIADLRNLARRRLPLGVFEFVDGGAGDEVTQRRNQADMYELVLMPRVLAGAGRADLSTTVLGQRVSVPLIGSPTGGTGLVHPDGEVALARAVNGGGSIYVLSTAATRTMEDVAGASRGPKWFQLYLGADREVGRVLLKRARELGFSALVLTVDTPAVGARERDQRNRFAERRLTGRTVVEGIRHPRWTANFLRSPRVLSAGVLESAVSEGARGRGSLISDQFDPVLSWKDIAWVQDHWDGPILLKGVLRPEDADHARRLGVAGVIVSNHGGRQFDHAPSALRALPAIVDAVGSDVEVFLDGGIRRGVDIAKALALGARACLAGRSLVYGLGAGGETGASRAMEVLTQELRLALTLMGASGVRDLDRGWLAAASLSRELTWSAPPAPLT
jgi:L-lactate dehydrogenase (cytochrome)